MTARKAYRCKQTLSRPKNPTKLPSQHAKSTTANYATTIKSKSYEDIKPKALVSTGLSPNDINKIQQNVKSSKSRIDLATEQMHTLMSADPIQENRLLKYVRCSVAKI